jgi:phage head maturation protease
MSFAFTVEEDSYNSESRTRTILKIKKLYDVAAVDTPAYDTTSISARSFFEAEAEREKTLVEANKQLRNKLILKTYL